MSVFFCLQPSSRPRDVIEPAGCIARLTDLVSRAEAGEDIVLTRHGHPTVRLVPVDRKPTAAEKRAALEKLVGIARDRPGLEGVTAATIDDYLYDEDGLPA